MRNLEVAVVSAQLCRRKESGVFLCYPFSAMVARRFRQGARCADSEEHAIAELRLAELIVALSQVTDLGMGQPPEEAARSCLLATSLARGMDLSERDVGDVYYATLLQHVGCTAYAHETAALFGDDDIALRAGGARIDFANPKQALPFLVFELGKGAAPLGRARAVIAAISKGQEFDEELARSNCEVAIQMTRRLGLGTGVQHGLNEIYERWDGKGNPRKLSGENIALPARFAQVASQAVLFDRLGGPDLASEVVLRRAGTALDPSIADTFLQHGRELLAEITSADASIAVIEIEPEPHRRISEPHLDEVARAFADLVDLKSPFLHGHSVAVSELAAAAATKLGLTEDEVVRVRRAGLLHDLGRTGASTTEEEILAFCKERLTAYKTSKAVEFREELPKSTVGKLLRRVLVEEERAKAEARPQS